MQIIQGIREKGAAIVIVVISLSLIGFILMDAKQGGNNYNSGGGSIGKVNGLAIEQNEFNKKIKKSPLFYFSFSILITHNYCFQQ